MPAEMRTIESDAIPEKADVAVVVSRYNQWITDRLLQGAVETFERLAPRGRVTVIPVPGSMELPVAAKVAAASGDFDAVVCIGCIIRGETEHDRHLASAVAQTLTQMSVEEELPVTFGVLTVENAEQAEARAGGPHGNKGAEAMEAALRLVAVLREI